MKKTLLAVTLLWSALSGLAQADDSAIQNTLQRLGVKVTDIQPSTLPGMKTVLTDSGVFYISDDGKQMIQGPLYDISGQHPVNVTFRQLGQKMEQMVPQMIIYKAAKQQHVVTVFTDITCGYCHKLHQQMADYNALGITVRYLAFPREGMGGGVAKAMTSVWCAADRNKAFDAAMNGSAPAPASCNIDLSRQYQLGLMYGIQGTPAILTENGTLIPGYQGPQELKQYLDSQSAGK